MFSAAAAAAQKKAAGGIAFGLRNPLNLAAAATAAATFNTICHLSSKRSASEDWKQQKKQWFFVIQNQNSRLLGQTIV